MFDRPGEIGLTLNLLKPKKEFPIGTDFNQKFLSHHNGNYKPKNIIVHMIGGITYMEIEKINNFSKKKILVN